MVTSTREPEAKAFEIESSQKRVAQVCGDIAAANQAADEAESRYRQIPDDETGKADRAKALEARDEHRESAESLRKMLLLGELEAFFDELHEKSLSLNQEFETLRREAEKTVRDIAVENKQADEQLDAYRQYLHDGEKLKSDKTLDAVHEHRKEAKKLARSLPTLVPEGNRLEQLIEAVRLRSNALQETGILLDIQARLKLAFGRAGQVQNVCMHTSMEIRKLEEFIKKQQ